jgi:hypothetical protein
MMGTVLLVDGSVDLVVPMDIVRFGPLVYDTLRQSKLLGIIGPCKHRRDGIEQYSRPYCQPYDFS